MKEIKYKDKAMFSDEVLVLATDLIETQDVREYLENNSFDISLIVDTIKYFEMKIKYNINKKNQLYSNDEYHSLEKIRHDITSHKKILLNLVKYKDTLLNKKEKEKGLKTNHNKKKYNFINNSELDILLQKLEEAEDKESVLTDILKLYQILLVDEEKKYNDLVSKKTEFLSNLEKIDDLEYADALKNGYYFELRRVLDNIKKIKRACNHYNKNIKSSDDSDTVIEISSAQEMIEEKIEFNEDISGFNIDDVLYALGHYIKYNENLDSDLLSYSKYAMNYFISESVDSENVINAIYYVWDSIKYRLRNTPKDDIEKRKLIKNVRILFDFTIKSYKEENKMVDHNYLFNVADYFFTTEDYFMYLKKIVNEVPEIVNVKHVRNDSKESEHIVNYLVDIFIENYKTMLFDKKKDYISKDYLREVYFLFTKCPYLYLTGEEKREIDGKLSNFMSVVNKNITSSRRKQAVKNDLADMYTNRLYFDNKKENLKMLDEHKLECQLNNLFINMKNDITKFSRVDLTNENSITLNSKYHAYSLEKDSDKTILKIHVIDLYNLIPAYSTLDKYLFNKSFSHEQLDDIILHNVGMIRDKVYPTITYEIVFNDKGDYKEQNNKVNFNVYNSKIKIKKCYSDYDLVYSRDDQVLNSYINLYRKSLIKNHFCYSENYFMDDINKYFETVLNDCVIKYFENNKLPFIYSGVRSRNKNEYVNIMNNIGHVLTRLDKEEFNKIYQVLSSGLNDSFYSTKPFNGNYQLSIMNPLDYSGILMQRILHELVFHNRYTKEEYEDMLRRYSDKCDATVMYMNLSNDYVDSDLLKSQKGRIVKEKKRLF